MLMGKAKALTCLLQHLWSGDGEVAKEVDKLGGLVAIAGHVWPELPQQLNEMHTL